MHPGLLLLIIIIGVTVGNLSTHYIELQAAKYAMQQAVVEMANTAEELRQQSDLQRKRAAEAATAARANSPTGQRLKRFCDEWNAADAQQSGPTTRAESQKACGRYKEYIWKGNVR